MYPTVVLRILNFKLSDRVPPNKRALVEGGTVLFETRSFVSLNFTVRASKFVDLLQSKQLRKELSLNFRESSKTVKKKEVLIVLPFLGYHSKHLTKQLRSCINKFYGIFDVKIFAYSMAKEISADRSGTYSRWGANSRIYGIAIILCHILFKWTY